MSLMHYAWYVGWSLSPRLLLPNHDSCMRIQDCETLVEQAAATNEGGSDPEWVARSR
jgi:hypothetical protein